MKVRLYLEEDSQDRRLVLSLRARGVDIVTAHEVGMIEREDEEHLEWAAEQRRVLFSFNAKDFYRLHSSFLAEGKSHRGIILAQQQRYSVGEQMRRILKLTVSRSAEEMINQVEFLGAWG